MNVADRVKQAGTATSDAVYVLSGAAATGYRTFAAGFNFPTAAVLGGTVPYPDVTILVERVSDGAWQVITASVQRDASDVVSIVSGVVRESSTGAALGLTGGAAVNLSVVPSYWNGNLAMFGNRTHANGSERFVRRPACSGGALMALGPRSLSGEKHATAQGYLAYTSLPYEDAVGCGYWPEANVGDAIHSRVVWQAYITTATAEKMACYDEDGLIASSDNYPLDSRGLYRLVGTLTAICAAANTKMVWAVDVTAWNDGTASPAQIGSGGFTEIGASALPWSVALTLTNAPDTLSLSVTGAASTSISWAFTGTLHRHVDFN